MSNLNLRLYAEQFYGLYIPKLNNYLSQLIEKENFISSFKIGFLNYKGISTKFQIILSQLITLNNIKINSFEAKIPDENNDLIIDIEGLKGDIYLSEKNENELEKIIIKEKNELKEKFIEIIYNKITKKTKNDFFGDIVFQSIGNKILSGLVLNIKNINLIITSQKCCFIVFIGNMEFNLKDKILNVSLKEIKISFKDGDNNLEENLLNINDINISIDFKENNEDNKNENCYTKLIIGINNFQINLNIKIIKAIFDIIDIFMEHKQKKLDIRKKKLIQFHKPKIKDNNYYELLWRYAIKNVIKIRKYICDNNINIFDISNFVQNKLIKNGDNKNIILVNDINILKSTRQIIEKKIIDNKDSIANKFFSFFSSKNGNSKTLSEEEKNLIEEYFKEENLVKYINGNLFNDEKKENSNHIVEKYGKYLHHFESEADINNFEIIFKNGSKIKEEKIYLNKIKFMLLFGKENLKIQLDLFEKNDNKLISQKNILESTNQIYNENIARKKIISFSYDNADKINILIEKEKFEISEDKLFLIILYSKFILERIDNKFILNKTSEIKSLNIENIIKKIYIKIF